MRSYWQNHQAGIGRVKHLEQEGLQNKLKANNFIQNENKKKFSIFGYFFKLLICIALGGAAGGVPGLAVGIFIGLLWAFPGID